MTELFHYTCQHGRDALGDHGFLNTPRALRRSFAELLPPQMQKLSELIWLTDLPVPDADALGLTRNYLRCDRTAHRYRFIDIPEVVAPWADIRGGQDPGLVAALESAPGVMPGHWWGAVFPLLVEYAPIEGAA